MTLDLSESRAFLTGERSPGIFASLCAVVGVGLGSPLSWPAALYPPGQSLPSSFCWEAGEWAQGQARVWMVASSARSLLFNIKSRARNCIKTCIIIPEEGRAQPLVIAGLL